MIGKQADAVSLLLVKGSMRIGGPEELTVHDRVNCPKFTPGKKLVYLGGGFGSFGRAVASNTIDLRFESRHWPILFTIICIKSS